MTLLTPLKRLLTHLALPRHSLRTRLMVWNMVTLAFLLVALGLVTLTLVRSIMLSSIDRELVQQTQRFLEPRPPHHDRGGPPPPGNVIAPPPPPPGFGPGEKHLAPEPDAVRRWHRIAFRARKKSGDSSPNDRPYWVLVLDLRGRVLAPPWEKTPWDKRVLRRAARGERIFSTTVLDGNPARVLTRPFPEQGAPKGVVQAAYTLTEVNRALAGLSRALLALIPLALLFAAMGGAFLTRRVLHPVRRMAQAAGRIGADDLSQRLPVSGKDEFWELGTTFNGMLQRLEAEFHEKELLVAQLRRLVEQQRRFTADASHELRTPLAVIKANTSLCLQGHPVEEDYRLSLEDIDRAANSMTRLVLDLLLLAHSDSGQLARDPITLAIGEVLERAVAPVSHRGGAAVRLQLPEAPLCVVGNEEELLRLFANLLENALRHTPAEGSVTLSAHQQGNVIRVAVADTGVGIAPEHLPHLGERFYRVDASRSRPEGGTGLGLSICRGIVEAHGGSMAFESTVGAGTTVYVTLPAADEPDEDAG